jgi:hypothetical protein
VFFNFFPRVAATTVTEPERETDRNLVRTTVTFDDPFALVLLEFNGLQDGEEVSTPKLEE